jgi:hypothetical protein
LRNSLFVASAAVAAAGVATWLTGYVRFVGLKKQCEQDCGDLKERNRRFRTSASSP